MGELEVFIHPCLRLRRQLGGELSRGKHHLMVAVREMIAIHVTL